MEMTGAQMAKSRRAKNKFKFIPDPRFKTIYAGLHKSFWHGYIYSDKAFWKANKANDPIGRAIQLRKKFAPSFLQPAFTKKHEIQEYGSHPVTQLSGVVPYDYIEPFEIWLSGP